MPGIRAQASGDWYPGIPSKVMVVSHHTDIPFYIIPPILISFYPL